MLLFKLEHVDAIKRGRKTQTRRRGARRWNVGTVHQARLHRFGSPVAYLEIISVAREPLGDITTTDAWREGYNNIAAFRDAWQRINGAWDAAEQVWVVTFRAVRKPRSA